ncbi:hypothetical protein PPL_09039 [Heterostelium album PN500]|uniref:E2F-associated phosphoprotein n=1 Tax=Heterostelium pallidum (strain ATCC 26659 / Pp 5 / PN500) TaxID=670386 RepID=D3BKF8_HETP5|nr:hypothetical protein PPL_09039 [Heterostelium album PN500]EFA78388.1 hypothetical protein PPL_09039 [Heterostelium album PN500]|eukprot:XP_020430513.1 hypothetical protein PPL_09039 [Heterostelium album PN500]
MTNKNDNNNNSKLNENFKKINFVDDDGDDNSSADDSSDLELDVNNELTQEEKDNLLYNEDEDDENEAWVEKNLKKSGSKSDAYLSCPCCFTLVCVDCQRHDTFKNQYRAMFVKNCKIDFSNRLLYQNDDGDDTLDEKQQEDDEEEVDDEQEEDDDNYNEDVNTPKEDNTANKKQVDTGTTKRNKEYYHAVHCQICSTQLAVYDQDEIYHFFNVFPSNS